MVAWCRVFLFTLQPLCILLHTCTDETSPVVLGLSHLQGAFYLLLLGLSFALIALLAERRVRPLTA